MDSSPCGHIRNTPVGCGIKDDELGATAHVSEVGGNWSFDGPKYRYMQELMWNVNADPDEIMWGYCRDSLIRNPVNVCT